MERMHLTTLVQCTCVNCIWCLLFVNANSNCTSRQLRELFGCGFSEDFLISDGFEYYIYSFYVESLKSMLKCMKTNNTAKYTQTHKLLILCDF